MACALPFLAWPAAAQTGGLAPEWEVRKDLSALAEHVARIKPILQQVRPANWQGAPSAYREQGKLLDSELGYLETTTKALADRPERLTTALSTYFRLQSLDLMVRSYAEGIRRYQNAALSELLLGMLSTVSADREKLRQYVVDLAADQEELMRVAGEEAQRCRALLSRQPRGAARAAERPKKEEQK